MSARSGSGRRQRGGNATAGKLATHEAVCALRYQGILDRMSRLEKIIISAATALIGGLAYIAWTLASHGLLK